MRGITGSVLSVLALLGAFALSAAGPAHAPARAFGVYVDPWHVDEWARAVGTKPRFAARFEAFSRDKTLDSFLRESERQGLDRVLVTWEPWRPVPPRRGLRAQYRPQRGYTNREIARGARDEYMLRFARSLASFRGRVYLRYAHEMNGTWYPWSHDPLEYRRGWRHMVRLFRLAGAHNVRFVWSVTPSLFLPLKTWARSLRVYWPGGRYVDAVGSTMINFGVGRQYAVARFAPRLRALRRVFHKPVALTEVNTAYRGRVQWLRDVRSMLRRSPWIHWFAWSQLKSRGKRDIKGAGRLNWNVMRDRAAARVLRGIARDGRG